MKSIFRYLVIRLLLAFAVLWIVCSLVIFFGMRNQLKRQLDYRLATQAEAVASLVEINADGILTMDFVEEFMPEFSRGGNHYFQIWKSDGETFLKSGSLKDDELPVGPAQHLERSWQDSPLPEGAAGRIHWLRFSPRADDEEHGDPGHEHQAEADRIPIAGRPVLCAAVLVPQSDLLDFLAMLRMMLVLSGFMCGVLLGYLVHRVVKGGLFPLDTLAKSARLISIDQAGSDFEDTEVIELKDVHLRLNDLLRRLREAFAHEQRFSSNVVHDLRTPIAELKTVVEVALRERKRGVAPRWETIEECREIAVEMDKLVYSLIEMLRYQQRSARGGTLPVETFDAMDEISGAVEKFSQGGPHRLDWRFERVAALPISTNRDVLSNILRQLFSNAARYAPCGSQVSVSVKRGTPPAILLFEIANPAPGIGPDEVRCLFEPFWKREAHRGNRGECGLGLSIAQAAAESIGGRLSARLCGDELVFSLSL